MGGEACRKALSIGGTARPTSIVSRAFGDDSERRFDYLPQTVAVCQCICKLLA